MRLGADGAETWVRDFGARRFSSRLAPRRPGIASETFDPISFDLAVEATPQGLSMHIVAWRFGKCPLPPRLAPKSSAIESVDAEGRFAFDVPIALPLIGRLVRYRGWLVPS